MTALDTPCVQLSLFERVRPVDPPATPASTASPSTGSVDAAVEPEVSLAREWARLAPGWSRLWGVPDLRHSLRVELSRRMRSSLGSFFPGERVVRIADVLFCAPPALMREVLCHEAAHAAVQTLHGDGVRPHGAEWKALMRLAGLEPRVRIPSELLGTAAQKAARRRWVWEHRCPRCRARRVAGRPVKRWRCRPCVESGRDGRLVITRRAAGSPRGAE